MRGLRVGRIGPFRQLARAALWTGILLSAVYALREIAHLADIIGSWIPTLRSWNPDTVKTVVAVAGVCIALYSAAIATANFALAISTFARTGRDRRSQKRKDHIALTSALRGGVRHKWPRVRDIRDLQDVGVRRVTNKRLITDDYGASPYVARDKDSDIDRALRQQRFVLVVGPPLSGKSRSAFEAVRRVFPRRALIAPEPTAIQALVERGTNFSNSVVWLDDLDSYTSSSALSPALVQYIAGHKNTVIVATMASATLAHAANTVADLAERVRIEVELTPSELASAEQSFLGLPSLRQVLEDYGIGGVVTAARELIEFFDTLKEARSNVYFLTLSAAALEIWGVGPPIRSQLLKEAFAATLKARSGSIDPDDKAIAEAFIEAEKPVRGSMGLLEHVAPDSWKANGYIVHRSRIDSRSLKAIAPPIRLIDLIEDPGDLLGLALSNRSLLPPVKRKLGRMARDLKSGQASMALGILEGLGGGRARAGKAIKWFKEAARLGEDAAYNLGTAYRQHGDLERAREWYEHAFQAGDKSAGVALMTIDDQAGKELDTRLAAALTDALDPHCTHIVGALLERRCEAGQIDGWYKARAQHGDPHAWTHLGLRAYAAGNVSSANRYFRLAAAGGDLQGTFRHASLLKGNADREVEKLLRMAYEAGDRGALMPLGAQYLRLKQYADAERVFAEGSQGGDLEAARMHLLLLYRRGERSVQVPRLERRLSRAGDMHSSLRLAVQAQAKGRSDEAQLWMSEAVRRGYPENASWLPPRWVARLSIAIRPWLARFEMTNFGRKIFILQNRFMRKATRWIETGRDNATPPAP